MPVVKVLPGGSSGGFAGPGREANDGGATRGNITAWTAGSARRLTRFLWSVLAPDLPDTGGWAVTLTMGGTPDNAKQWEYVRKLLLEHAARCSARYEREHGPRADARGVVIEHAVHWLTEWTAKGRPHLHMAVYSPDPQIDGKMVTKWIELCRRFGWETSYRAQHLVPIEGVTGWFEYVSKHSARGVDHYQRQGAPEGWTRTGRLWGYGGTWPVWDAEEYQLTREEFWRWRRLLVSYQRAKLRARGTPKSGYNRVGKALRDKEKGRFAGVGYWVDAAVCIKLLTSVQDEGGSSFTKVTERLGDNFNGIDHTCHDPGNCRRLLRANRQVQQRW